MKKLLFVEALGVAGLMSANAKTEGSSQNQKLVTSTKYISGTCVVNIYRENSDGTTTVVKTDVSLQTSDEACKMHAQIVLMHAQLGN